VDTPAGAVPRVPTHLASRDRWGTVMARIGVRRMHYAVPPGLYAAGDPTPESHVFVTANYKMSFDRLRSALRGRDAWILVLDTKGINVWCAAGKGSFGTGQILRQVRAAQLSEVVSHRTLIVPQLGAPGVAAHVVKKKTGFRVVFGPARADDLPAFLDAGMKASPEMRQVRFPLRDRLALIPLELGISLKYIALPLLLLLALSGITPEGYSANAVFEAGSRAVAIFLLGVALGAAVTPALLPWLPGRAFSVKGAALALLVMIVWAGLGWSGADSSGRLELGAWLFLVPAISAFLAMNFTGASTYTSLSGVKREMQFAVPAQIIAALIGAGLWIASRLVS
jgi:CO dehydrogenase/acetyl-CoA synthase delta subunit